MYIVFLDSAIVHITDCTINTTFMCPEKREILLTHLIVIFALVQ